MLKKVLRVGAVRRCLCLAAKTSHIGVDVPPTPSCGLQPTDEGTRPFARRHIVLSLQWVVAPFGGCEAPRHGYLM
jgi:hypothetical protein